MSIKDIEDSLNNVKDIDLEQIDTNKEKINNISTKLYLKNLYNDIYHNNDVIQSQIFFLIKHII